AIPRTEIAVGEHAVGELTAQLKRAGPRRWVRQRRVSSDRFPRREKNRSEAIELSPKRILAACRRIELRGDRCGNAELGWAPVLGNVQVPRQRAADRWIVPNSQP